MQWKIEFHKREAEDYFLKYIGKEEKSNIKEYWAKRFVEEVWELDGATYNSVIEDCAQLLDMTTGKFWDFIRKEAGIQLREWQPRGVISAFGKRYII